MGTLSSVRFIGSYLAEVLEIVETKGESHPRGAGAPHSASHKQWQAQVAHVFGVLVKREKLVGVVAVTYLSQVIFHSRMVCA